MDYRFVRHDNIGNFPKAVNKHSKFYFVDKIRPEIDKDGRLEYLELPVINEHFSGITPVGAITNVKLKHKCIHKGKCPHRGYDLSQVNPDRDGKITCPLHGLQFDALTKKLLNDPSKFSEDPGSTT